MPHHLDYPSAILRDGLALVEAAAAAGPATEVRCCPGWDVAQLVRHVTEVHYFWRTIVERRLRDPGEVPPLTPPTGFGDLLTACREGVTHLVDILAAAHPATPVWTWARQQDAAFVTRHQAQETAVHRWDAERAAGRAFSIEPTLAADAVDEFLEHTGGPRRAEAVPVRGSVHLHATDAAGEWTVAEGADLGLVVERGHRRGDAAVRAGASDLLLLLYRRLGADAVAHFGDEAVLARFLARADLS